VSALPYANATDQERADAAGHAALRALVSRRFAQSTQVPLRFFTLNAERIAHCCLEMARRFERGGRLLVMGEGAEATDAAHVSVEFVHPVLVGKRALPAIALTSDAASLSGVARSAADSRAFAREIAVLGRAQDIAMAITREAPSPALLHGLAAAAERGLLTLLIAGMTWAPAGASVATGPAAAAGFAFRVESADPFVVQEVQETLYHVFWELVHVFFEAGVAS
jgi:D-sedoheptulose 7-phosphate isomerase